MNITQAKQQIKDTVEAYLQTDDAGMFAISPVHQRPVFLLGAPGIGKTAIMEQVAQELGIGIVSYSMTHHTRQSALGLPRIEHHEFEGYEYEASEYTMSEIVAAIYSYMERTGRRQGILFLDEINCVSETLYPSMLQFLQFKTFGKHRVPEGWVVVCAGNPPEYNRSVHEFDIVTLDRLRQIDVEPDYAAWKDYAARKGLHPAVTTFLETKRDCFYKVEQRPGGGKAFVTARGWEDLAQVIALYEQMGKPVGRELIAQFLHDDDVADRFAVYYALFEKYRSDYQVEDILAGCAPAAIKDRAREAEFDERIALISLVLDALARDCAAVLEREAVVLAVRDVLRQVKPELLGGAAVEESLAPREAERERALAAVVGTGTLPDAEVRKERLVIAQLKDLSARCALAGEATGEAAFRVIERAYSDEVAAVKAAAATAGARMDAAFGFVDECFASRELLVFMAELATRKPTTQFVAHYGNDAYYAHNKELQVDSARMGLAERASLLEELNDNIASAGNVSAPGVGAAGLSNLSARDVESLDSAASRADSSTSAEPEAERLRPQASQPSLRPSVLGAACGDLRDSASSAEALRAHYSGKQFEYGFASMCKMVLPVAELKGKRILDICCRRGRGVYKLSGMAGDKGSALGIDWNRAYIEEAKDGMARAWRDSGLSRNNMEFRVAYPEDLIAAGIGTATMDAVYVNSVVTLFYDQAAALREFGRVLKPGGLLVLETVFADRPRSEGVVARARELGNSIQAALTKEENCAMLAAAGFGEPQVVESYEVPVNRGYKAGSVVEVAPGDEDVRYEAVTLYVRKG